MASIKDYLSHMNEGEQVFVQDLLRCGLVKRWHTECLPMPQSTAEHSWGVALLLFLAGAPREVIGAALLHDLPEHETGDTPTPEKNAHPQLRRYLEAEEDRWFSARGLKFRLTEAERTILKRADKLEARLWLQNAYDLTGSPHILRLIEYSVRKEKEDREQDDFWGSINEV